MPVHSRPHSRAVRNSRLKSSSTAKYNAMISSRLDELEASIQRIHSGRAVRRAGSAPGRRPSVASVTETLKTADLHSMIEKAAAVTSKWQDTAGMVGIIGRNVKSIASPVLGGLKLANPLSAIMGRMGGATGMANGASQGGRAAAAGTGGGPLSGLVSQVLASMQPGQDAGD